MLVIKPRGVCRQRAVLDLQISKDQHLEQGAVRMTQQERTPCYMLSGFLGAGEQ